MVVSEEHDEAKHRGPKQFVVVSLQFGIINPSPY